MPINSSGPSPQHRPVIHERRASGLLGWLKGLVYRPLRVKRSGMQVHLTLPDRRRPLQVQEAEALQALRSELQARLKGRGQPQPAARMAPLLAVDEALARQGWPGVADLQSHVLRDARAQVRDLLQQAPSEILEDLAERLSILRGAAEAREDRSTRGNKPT